MQICMAFFEWLLYMPLHFAALPKNSGYKGTCKVMDVGRETGFLNIVFTPG